MVETLKLKEKNKIKKLEKNAETRMAVYIYIYIVYCHLENKKAIVCSFINFNKKIKDRTILKFISIGLSFCCYYKEKRAGPKYYKISYI